VGPILIHGLEHLSPSPDLEGLEGPKAILTFGVFHPSISHEWYRILFAGTCRDKTNWETLTSEAFPLFVSFWFDAYEFALGPRERITNFESLQEHRNRTRHVQCEVPTRERNPVAYESCGIDIPQVPSAPYSSRLELGCREACLVAKPSWQMELKRILR
jgi:hypothetical protein